MNAADLPLGCYGVVRTRGLAGATIRLATRSRFNHAWVHIGGGTIVEAEPGGARLGSADDYADCPGGTNAGEPLTDAQRAAIVAAARAMIGRGYSWLDIAALGLRQFGIRSAWLTGRIKRTDRVICSQLVDYAYEQAGVTLFADGRLPQDVTPGDLAERIVEQPWGALDEPLTDDPKE